MSEMSKISETNDPGFSTLTVLIVDSDSTQMESLSRGMVLYGHQCIQKKTISQAIDFLNKPGGIEVDLLLTDTTSQNGHGIQLVEHVRALFPRLPMVCVSGLNSLVETKIQSDSGISIIRRPFRPSDLDETIRDLVA